MSGRTCTGRREEARLKRTRWGTDEFTALDRDGNSITFWSVTVT